MTTDHVHFARRASYRWWHALAALAIFPLIVEAGSVNRNNIGRAGITQTGRTTTITPGAPPVNSGGSTIPVSPSYGGWSQAGNYGVPPSSTGPTAGLNVNGTFIQGERGNFNIGGAGGVQGVRYPVSGSYQIPWSTVAPVAAGIICVIGTAGACGVAGAVAAASPYIMDWINRAGGRRNPETGELERQGDDTWLWVVNGEVQPRDSAVGACKRYASVHHPSEMGFLQADTWEFLELRPRGVDLYWCSLLVRNASGGVKNSVDLAQEFQANTWQPGSYLPSSMDDIVPYMQKVNPDPRVWGEVLERGGEIPMPDPVVTGPTQIPGPETVKQNQDGTREVSRTTYNFTTNGNQVTNTSNVTTTNIFNNSNTQISSTTTTTTPSDNTPGAEQEEPEDACTKHPEALGCQKIDFDTPDGEIPKQDKQITYAPESVLTGGSCPAPRELAYGRSFSYAATCDALTTYVRPMVIAIAGWIAIVIIFGVGRPE